MAIPNSCLSGAAAARPRPRRGRSCGRGGAAAKASAGGCGKKLWTFWAFQTFSGVFDRFRPFGLILHGAYFTDTAVLLEQPEDLILRRFGEDSNGKSLLIYLFAAAVLQL